MTFTEKSDQEDMAEIIKILRAPDGHIFSDILRARVDGSNYIENLNRANLRLRAEVTRLDRLLNTPELHDFIKAVPLEASHQRQRWGSDHDDGKTAADWFWLIGYLAGKALHSQTSGNTEKALHHVITTAAALANWHAAILGKTDMRPGIANPEKEGAIP